MSQATAPVAGPVCYWILGDGDPAGLDVRAALHDLLRIVALTPAGA